MNEVTMNEVTMNMEQVADCLETLGYGVEEQGRIKKFLTVFKEDMPIGFIFPDCSVQLISGVEEHALQSVIDFVRANQSRPSVNKNEYLLAAFKDSQLTTLFDMDKQRAAYRLYIVDERGLCKPSVPYTDYDEAISAFLSQSGMVDRVPHQTWLTRFRRWRVNRLMDKL